MREQLPLTNIQPDACPPEDPHIYFLPYDGDTHLRQQGRLYMGSMQLLCGWSGPEYSGRQLPNAPNYALTSISQSSDVAGSVDTDLA